MKPIDLKPPFSTREERKVLIKDRAWFLPDMDHPEENFTFPGFEHPDLFGNNRPVCIEFCSGNGAWIAERAKSHPELNWLAVEIRFMRSRKIWSKIKNLELKNLVVLCGEGMHAARKYLPSNSVQSVYVNFPDPWPKRRHAKNRIIQPDFVKEVERITVSGGDLTLVTDDVDYSTQMIDTVLNNPAYRSSYPEPYYVTNSTDYGASWFESLWREKGKSIRFHHFNKQ